MMNQMNQEVMEFLKTFVEEYERRDMASQKLIKQQGKLLESLQEKLELVERNYKKTRENYQQISDQYSALMTALNSFDAEQDSTRSMAHQRAEPDFFDELQEEIQHWPAQEPEGMKP